MQAIHKPNGTGACAYTALTHVNPLGIVILLMVSAACIIFKNEEVFYFALLLQTMSLAYFVEVLWLTPLGYILNALTYLMPLSLVSRAYKEDQTSLGENSFKAGYWFRTAQITSNMAMIGITNVLLIFLLILVPLTRALLNRLHP